MCKGKQWFLVGLLPVLILMLIGWGGQAQSQEKYPTRAIDIIVPFSPGGGTDTAARVPAAYLTKKWGVPVNVVNKPGGNTVPANMELYNAPPNGYTLLLDSPPSSSMLEVVVKDLPIKVVDRTFIAMTVSTPMMFIVPGNSPFKTLEDVIAEAKRDPENFTWASLGGASGLDVITRQLLRAIGVDVLKTKPVMFKGGAQVVPAVAGGNLKLGSTHVTTARAAMKAGIVRMVAIARERNPEFPDVPTTAELGYPSVNAVSWHCFSGPPKMPQYIVDIWDKVTQEMLKDPELLSRFANVGFKPTYLNSSGTREFVLKEAEEIAELWGIKKK